MDRFNSDDEWRYRYTFHRDQPGSFGLVDWIELYRIGATEPGENGDWADRQSKESSPA